MLIAKAVASGGAGGRGGGGGQLLPQNILEKNYFFEVLSQKPEFSFSQPIAFLFETD